MSKNPLQITRINLQDNYKEIDNLIQSVDFKTYHANDNLLLNLRARIKSIIFSQNLTQESLALKMGISQNQVHRLVNGKAGFSFSTLQKFCIATGTTIDFVS